MLETLPPVPHASNSTPYDQGWSNDPLTALRREVDRSFDHLACEIRAFQPRLDVREGDGHVLIAAALPGVAPETLDLHVRGDLITISGGPAVASQDDRHGWYRRERLRAGSSGPSAYRSRSTPTPSRPRPSTLSCRCGSPSPKGTVPACSAS